MSIPKIINLQRVTNEAESEIRRLVPFVSSESALENIKPVPPPPFLGEVLSHTYVWEKMSVLAGLYADLYPFLKAEVNSKALSQRTVDAFYSHLLQLSWNSLLLNQDLDGVMEPLSGHIPKLIPHLHEIAGGLLRSARGVLRKVRQEETKKRLSFLIGCLVTHQTVFSCFYDSERIGSIYDISQVTEYQQCRNTIADCAEFWEETIRAFYCARLFDEGGGDLIAKEYQFLVGLADQIRKSPPEDVLKHLASLRPEIDLAPHKLFQELKKGKFPEEIDWLRAQFAGELCSNMETMISSALIDPFVLDEMHTRKFREERFCQQLGLKSLKKTKKKTKDILAKELEGKVSDILNHLKKEYFSEFETSIRECQSIVIGEKASNDGNHELVGLFSQKFVRKRDQGVPQKAIKKHLLELKAEYQSKALQSNAASEQQSRIEELFFNGISPLLNFYLFLEDLDYFQTAESSSFGDWEDLLTAVQWPERKPEESLSSQEEAQSPVPAIASDEKQPVQPLSSPLQEEKIPLKPQKKASSTPLQPYIREGRKPHPEEEFNPRNYSSHEMGKSLHAAGFQCIRSTGHLQYCHPITKVETSLSLHSGTLKRKTAASILKAIQESNERLENRRRREEKKE